MYLQTQAVPLTPAASNCICNASLSIPIPDSRVLSPRGVSLDHGAVS